MMGAYMPPLKVQIESKRLSVGTLNSLSHTLQEGNTNRRKNRPLVTGFLGQIVNPTICPTGQDNQPALQLLAQLPELQEHGWKLLGKFPDPLPWQQSQVQKALSQSSESEKEKAWGFFTNVIH